MGNNLNIKKSKGYDNTNSKRKLVPILQTVVGLITAGIPFFPTLSWIKGNILIGIYFINFVIFLYAILTKKSSKVFSILLFLISIWMLIYLLVLLFLALFGVLDTPGFMSLYN